MYFYSTLLLFEAVTSRSKQSTGSEFASLTSLYGFSILVLVTDIAFQVVILAFVEDDICYKDIYVRGAALKKSAAVT